MGREQIQAAARWFVRDDNSTARAAFDQRRMRAQIESAFAALAVALEAVRFEHLIRLPGALVLLRPEAVRCRDRGGDRGDSDGERAVAHPMARVSYRDSPCVGVVFAGSSSSFHSGGFTPSR